MQRLFLSLTNPDELASSCYSSEYGREICSGREFWEEKFNREGLPLLEEGNDPQTWLEIYRKSQKVARKTEKRMQSPRVSIFLVDVTDPDMLLPLSRSAFILPFWKNRHGHGYRLDFNPSYTDGVYSYVLVELPRQKADYAGRLIIKSERLEPILKGTVGAMDLWNIIYQEIYNEKPLLDRLNDYILSL